MSRHDEPSLDEKYGADTPSTKHFQPTCDDCGQPLPVGAWPWCPHGDCTLKVINDTIPGGLYIETLGKTFHSHTERKDYLRAKGLREAVRHVGTQGSDKSPHTTRWT